MARSITVGLVGLGLCLVGARAVVGCGDPAPEPEASFAFVPARVVWQRNDGTVRDVFLVDVGRGRTYVAAGAGGTDGSEQVYLLERAGTDFSAPVPLIRPAGTNRERLAWVTQSPGAAIFTVASGALGSAVFVRRFENERFLPPEAVTQAGLERVEDVRASLGNAGPDGRRRIHVVYSDSFMSPAGCAMGGLTLRHRYYENGGWSASRIAAQACSVSSFAMAAGTLSREPLMVVFAGLPAGGAATGGDTPAFYGVPSRTGLPAMFEQPFRIVGTATRSVQLVPQAGGRFVATWHASGTSTDVPQQRAGIVAYDPDRQVWDRPNISWFFTSVAPFPMAYGASVLGFGGETDAAFPRLAVWRWGGAGDPVLDRSRVAQSSGVPSSLRLTQTSDGTLGAVWVESQGGQQRVFWSETLGGVAPVGDAGR